MKRQRYLDDNGSWQYVDEIPSVEDVKPEKKQLAEKKQVAYVPVASTTYVKEDLQALLIVELRAIASKEKKEFNKRATKTKLIELILGK